MDSRMEQQFGSNALKKAQTSLWLVGPQLNSPQICHPGISFDCLGFLLILQLTLQYSFCLQLDFSHGYECCGKYKRNKIRKTNCNCLDGVLSVQFCHLALTPSFQHFQLQVCVTFYKMAHPVQLHASLMEVQVMRTVSSSYYCGNMYHKGNAKVWIWSSQLLLHQPVFHHCF